MKYRIRAFIMGMLIPVVVMTYYNAWYGGCREECKQKVIMEHYTQVFNDLGVASEVTRITNKKGKL